MPISGLLSILSPPPLLLLLLLSVVASVRPEPQTRYCASQDFRRLWTPDHYKIYATNSAMRLEPSETLDLIRRLLITYEKSGCLLEEAPHNDGGVRRRVDLLRQLVAAGELVRAGPAALECNTVSWSKLAKISQLIDFNQPYRVNVVPLLETSRAKLLENCSGRFELQLRALFEAQPSKGICVDEEFIEWARKKLPTDYNQPELVEWLLGLAEARIVGRSRDGQQMAQPSSPLASTRALVGRASAKPVSISFDELEEIFDNFRSKSCALFHEHLQAELERPFRLTRDEHLRYFQRLTSDPVLDRWLQYARVYLDLSKHSAELERELVLVNLMNRYKSLSL